MLILVGAVEYDVGKFHTHWTVDVYIVTRRQYIVTRPV